MRLSHHGFALAIGIALLSSAAFAADPTPAPAPDPTQAQRQQMAAIHTKMAECLGSTRPFAECRAEMHASCMQTLGQGGCPMMGAGMGPGMGMGRGMMYGAPQSPPPKQP